METLFYVWFAGVAVFAAISVWTRWRRRDFDVTHVLTILGWPMVILWLVVVLIVSLLAGALDDDGD